MGVWLAGVYSNILLSYSWICSDLQPQQPPPPPLRRTQMHLCLTVECIASSLHLSVF